MEKITKDNKGITLVTLVITIILMLILTSVATYTGIESYKNAEVTKFIVQMQLIQGKVDELKENESIEDLIEMGEDVPIREQAILTEAYENEEISSDEIYLYRYFSTEDIKQQLGLEDAIDEEIMINFGTREVVSTSGIDYDNKMYYTQYKLPNGQKLINNTIGINRNMEFELKAEVDGLNARITISNIKITNGTLKYRENGEQYWKNITNYTENGKNYDILISKSSIYEFKLADNATEKESAVINEKIVLINKPKTDKQIDSYNYALTSEKWAYSTDENGNNYVWIPRFAYKIDEETNTTEIKFIKGTSNITTDDFVINDEWEIHEKLNSEDGKKFTGIWVQSEVLSDLNMITLLDSETDPLEEI